jgi:hypothetical protein
LPQIAAYAKIGFVVLLASNEDKSAYGPALIAAGRFGLNYPGGVLPIAVRSSRRPGAADRRGRKPRMISALSAATAIQ